jgi:hypothetical protein
MLEDYSVPNTNDYALVCESPTHSSQAWTYGTGMCRRAAASRRNERTSADSAKPASRFEYLAAMNGRISSWRGGILGTLLAATLPETYRGHSELRPLWANEAMERAYTTICLIDSLEQAVPVRDLEPSRGFNESTLASHLARLLTSARYSAADMPRPCSPLLRATVQNVVGLFGPSVGGVEVTILAEPMSLPACKTRALVLLANDLVVNALRHGLHTPDGGRISVTLTRVRGMIGELQVADTGAGFLNSRPNPLSVAHDLASLLETEPIFSSPRAGGVCVSVAFPIRA